MKRKTRRLIMKEIVEYFGGQSALARAIGECQQNVWYWLQKNQVPYRHVLTIERASNGKFTRHEMRPDLYEL